MKYLNRSHTIGLLIIVLNLGLCLAANIQAATATTTVLTSGDAGGGLALEAGNVVGACHFGSDNTTYTVQGVDFPDNANTPPNSAYFTVSGSFSSPGFQGDFDAGMPDFGSGGSVDSTNLAAICQQIYFGRTTATGPGAGFNFTIGNLAPFSTNQIDLINYIGSFGPRQTIIILTNLDGSSLSLTLNQTNNRPLDAQFSGFVADASGSIRGRIQQGAYGDGAWVSAVVVTYQGQGPIQTWTWNGNPNGNWDVGTTTNWLLHGVPLAYTNETIVRFDDSATGTTLVNQTTSVSPASLTVSNINQDYTFAGNGSIDNVALLKQGAGKLTINSINHFLAPSQIQNGTVVLTAPTTVTGSGGLWVGSTTNNGASLLISNTTLVSSDYLVVGRGGGSVGNNYYLTLTNASVTCLHFSCGWDGNLANNNANQFVNLYGNSVLNDTGTYGFYIGESAGSTTAMEMDGNSALIKTNGYFSLGLAGAASLTLRNNASLTNSGDFNVSDTGISQGTLNVQDNATLMLLGNVFVGKGDSPDGSGAVGTLNQSGGIINAGNYFSIGRYPGASGQVTISGGALNQYNPGANLLVGEEGTGVLTISDTGAVNCVNSIILGNAATADGTINLNGGTLMTKAIQGASTPGSSTFNFNGGILKAMPGASANFMSYLYYAYVQSGGAIIDSGTNNITIAQTLNDGGGGLTKLGTGTLTLTAANNYSGPTLVNAGELAITTGSQAGGDYTVADGTAFGVAVTTANSGIYANSLTLGDSALDLNMGSYGNPSYAPVNVNSLVKNGVTTINFADALPQIGQFPLITYNNMSGAGGFILGSVPVGVEASIITNTASHSIDLSISAVNLPEWSGLQNGNWDIGLTTNWVILGTSTPTTYGEGNFVTFDDTALGTTSVNLVATVHPSVVTFTNDLLDYALGGSGQIAGPTGLTKQGAGQLTITNTPGNSYTGPTVIEGGTVVVNHLADGGVTSSIGAASSDPANLVLDGGILSYQGVPTVISRGYTVQNAGGALDIQSDLTLSGQVAAASGSGFAKTGTGTLSYTGAGNNVLGGDAFPGYDIKAGSVVFAGSGQQTNSVSGEFWVGDPTAGNVSCILSNTVLNTGTYLNVGRNAAPGNISTLILTNAVVNQGNGLVLGFYDSAYGSPLISTQMVSLSGSSSLDSPGDTFIADMGGSVGTVTVMDKSSLTVGGNFFVAPRGYTDGTLNISGNSSITINNPGGGGAFVAGYNTWWGGDSLSKTGRVNQTGGTFTVPNGDLQIGSQGDGTWNLSGGDVLAGGWTSVGRFPAGTGHLNVSGGVFTQTGANGNALMIAEQGYGTMTVSGSGTVNCLGSQGLLIGGSDGAATPGYGTVNLNGGTIVANVVYLAGVGYSTGTFNFNGGTLRAAVDNSSFIHDLTLANIETNGAIIDDAGFSIGIPQSLAGDAAGDGGLTKLGNGTLALDGVNTYTNKTVVTAGTLTGTGTLDGPVVINPGSTFAPGGNLGTMTIADSPIFNGSIRFMVSKDGGVSSSSHLAVNAPLVYNGDLIVTNSGTNNLSPGDTFSFFSAAGAISGAFAHVTTESPGQFVKWTPDSPAPGQWTVADVTSSKTPMLTNSVSAGHLTLSWSAANIGWTLQMQTNSLTTGLGTNWMTIPGSAAVNTESFPVETTHGCAFYRLIYQP